MVFVTFFNGINGTKLTNVRHIITDFFYYTASQRFAECLKTVERMESIGPKWVDKELVFMSPFVPSLLTNKVRSKLVSCHLAACQEIL